eukprot:Pompholyxophrys_punicea_v1_NODE_263_length_2482_cov_7.692466.p1 type:complete len:116 gc:universal NODE_263_length_2482_cov_7.692466:681-334(-)
MNNISSLLKKPINKNYLKHGISNLHSYIRCLEYVLNVSIRLKMGYLKWRIVKAKKEEVKEKKNEIRNSLRDILGIIVNMVKQEFGPTNDGNTCRRFFSNTKIAAQCTGFDERPSL